MKLPETLDVDPFSDELISLHTVAAECPTKPHVNTVRKWVTDGVRGIKLPVAYVGRTPMTTKDAVREFHKQVSTRGKRMPTAAQQQELHIRQVIIRTLLDDITADTVEVSDINDGDTLPLMVEHDGQWWICKMYDETRERGLAVYSRGVQIDVNG